LQNEEAIYNEHLFWLPGTYLIVLKYVSCLQRV